MRHRQAWAMTALVRTRAAWFIQSQGRLVKETVRPSAVLRSSAYNHCHHAKKSVHARGRAGASTCRRARLQGVRNTQSQTMIGNCKPAAGKLVLPLVDGAKHCVISSISPCTMLEQHIPASYGNARCQRCAHSTWLKYHENAIRHTTA